MAAKGWKRPFDDPIPLPRGRELVTLEDAGTYITKLPKARARGAGMASGNAGVAACPVAAPPKAGHKTFVLWPLRQLTVEVADRACPG